MQERQLFGLIVRTIGFVLFLYSVLFALFYVVAKLLAPYVPARMSTAADLGACALYFVSGVAIIRSRAGKWLVRFAYGSRERPDRRRV
jgi:O-antigen ligase